MSTTTATAVIKPAINLRARAGLIGGLLLLILFWFIPVHENPAASHAIAISGLMILLWATEALDYALAGLVGCFLFWALGVTKFETAFSGFANETSWFLLGTILISTMASKSGLDQRLARAITRRIGTSYRRLLLAFIIIDFCLTFLIPSGIARVTLLAAIACGAVQAFGIAPRSNAGRALLVSVAYVAALFDKALLAGDAAVVARGLMEQAGNVRITYAQWILAYLPCDLITIVCCWRIMLWLYPHERQDFAGGAVPHGDRVAPWSPAEKRCALLLAIATVLWTTGFFHHVNPSTVGLSIGLLALAPLIGVLDANDLRTISFGPVWFMAAALSMGRVLAETQALVAVTRTMLTWMESFANGPFVSLGLYWTGFVYHLFFSDETLMLSTSLPPILKLFSARGLHPLPIGLIWTFASGGKVFAYQSAVLVAGYSFGYFEAKDLLKVGLVLSIVQSIILFLLVSLYWPLIGIV